ncbi:MAG TPA: hypothetical protein PKA28_01275 [Methylomusa anaerophila]|uniref:Uncharacterized protein n=1 Tax=Methylomusa anaerophila TaxID=1930071 RepID=A0A348APV7_9FIRM|nr:hypothetical protein [Methylomusa anaerophila]BBB93105.1 hypothetical protein MAMMFC1_03814 [Methylomusa anaerophila]HML87062.1 hypothetical protein [Methylomusa anaerophila]
MPEFSHEDQQVSDGVNLLISMLVRYPEIGTINFEPDSNSLKLTFMISGILSDKDYKATKKMLTDSALAYHMLVGLRNSHIDVEISSYRQVTILTILRDVHTLSRGEIALAIKLLREQFIDRLVADRNDAMLEEDLLMQDELIEDMLENMRQENNGHNSLIGIREDGRVFVFNK